MDILGQELAARLLKDARDNSRLPKTLHLHYRGGRGGATVERAKSCPVPRGIAKILTNEALQGGADVKEATRDKEAGNEMRVLGITEGGNGQITRHQEAGEEGLRAEMRNTSERVAIQDATPVSASNKEGHSQVLRKSDVDVEAQLRRLLASVGLALLCGKEEALRLMREASPEAAQGLSRGLKPPRKLHAESVATEQPQHSAEAIDGYKAEMDSGERGQGGYNGRHEGAEEVRDVAAVVLDRMQDGREQREQDESKSESRRSGTGLRPEWLPLMRLALSATGFEPLEAKVRYTQSDMNNC